MQASEVIYTDNLIRKYKRRKAKRTGQTSIPREETRREECNEVRKEARERGRAEGRNEGKTAKEGREKSRNEEREERKINTNRLTGGPAEGKTETVIVVRGEEMSMAENGIRRKQREDMRKYIQQTERQNDRQNGERKQERTHEGDQ